MPDENSGHSRSAFAAAQLPEFIRNDLKAVFSLSLHSDDYYEVLSSDIQGLTSESGSVRILHVRLLWDFRPGTERAVKMFMLALFQWRRL